MDKVKAFVKEYYDKFLNLNYWYKMAIGFVIGLLFGMVLI